MLDEPRDEPSGEAEEIDEIMDDALPEQLDRESIEEQGTGGPGLEVAEGGESGPEAEQGF